MLETTFILTKDHHFGLWYFVLFACFFSGPHQHPLHHGNAPLEGPAIAQRQSWLSKYQLMCHGKLYYYVVYLQGLLFLKVWPNLHFFEIKTQAV